MPNAALTALEHKYLTPKAPVHSETTAVRFFVDGVAYFDELSKLIQQVEATPAGSRIWIAGWWFDATFDLRGGSATPPVQPLVARLAECADAGTDVRIVLNGGLNLYKAVNTWIVGLLLGTPFRDNFLAMKAMRAFKLTNGHTPLANSVLFDWSGPLVMGSQHQKATIVQVGSSPPVAFVGGLDYQPTRRDRTPHTSMVYPKGGGPWGWHDAGVKLEGAAVNAVWESFRSRWNEAMTLPERSYTDYDATPTVVPTPDGGFYLDWPEAPFNRPVQAVDPPPAPVPVATPNRSVQVLQSRYPKKIPGLIWGGTPWDQIDPNYPDGGIRQVYDTFLKAIDAATTYIYIEDQFLGDSPTTPGGESNAEDYSLIKHLKQRIGDLTRDVRLILVGSGLSDPGDLLPGPRNQTFADVADGDLEDDLYDLLPDNRKGNLVVWRIPNTTVHSKIVMIDDEFLAIGSANIHSRSMYGVDGELSVAVVDSGQAGNNSIEDFRVKLWAEHLRQPVGTSLEGFPGDPGWALAPGVEAALRDLTTGLGAWNPAWLPPGAAGMWSFPGNPPGYQDPNPVGRVFVGPP